MKIKKNQDAFGGEILDYYNGIRGIQEIVERNDGFISTGGGPASYFNPYPKWPSHQKKGIKFVRGKALDIGCGAGRVSLHLQQKGLEVLGIDTSPLAVKVCRLRGVKNIKIMSVTEIDTSLGQFDTIVMYGNNFGLLGSLNRGRWLLKRFYKMTSDKGRIIAESCNPYLTKEPDHLAYHRYNRKHGRMSGQLRLRVRYKKLTTPWFDYLLASPDEVRKIIRDTGWKLSQLFETPSGPYVMILEKE